MRRFVIIMMAVPLVAGGCGFTPSPVDRATDDARDGARRAARASTSSRVWSARDLAHRVDDKRDIEVMGFSGTSTAGRGRVRVVVRTSGTGAENWPDTGTVTVRRCFALTFDRVDHETPEPKDVRCPGNEPLTFAPWPKTPDLPWERLRKALPRVPAGGTADEGEVRDAVASLRLDPAVRVEVKTQGDVVGVVLTVKPYLVEAVDCVLARVAPGRTNVWSPPRIQRMPGEGGCSAANAITPMRPPH